jgi:hypothetical protein
MTLKHAIRLAGPTVGIGFVDMMYSILYISAMKSTRQSILRRMAAIDRMERGKLCPMRGGRYYNLQSWEGGRNVVRYVRADEVKAVRQAVEGYTRFMDLARRYADLIVQDTRKAGRLAKNEPEKVKKKDF